MLIRFRVAFSGSNRWDVEKLEAAERFTLLYLHKNDRLARLLPPSLLAFGGCCILLAFGVARVKLCVCSSAADT